MSRANKLKVCKREMYIKVNGMLWKQHVKNMRKRWKGLECLLDITYLHIKLSLLKIKNISHILFHSLGGFVCRNI